MSQAGVFSSHDERMEQKFDRIIVLLEWIAEQKAGAERDKVNTRTTVECAICKSDLTEYFPKPTLTEVEKISGLCTVTHNCPDGRHGLLLVTMSGEKP